MRLLCAFRYFHSFLDVYSHMIGAEVEDWQVIQAVAAEQENEKDGIVGGNPLR